MGRATPISAEEAAANRASFWDSISDAFNWLVDKDGQMEKAKNQLTALGQKSPDEAFKILTQPAAGRGDPNDPFKSIRGSMKDMTAFADNADFKKHLQTALQNPAFVDKLVAMEADGAGIEFDQYADIINTPYGKTAAVNLMAEIAANPAALDNMDDSLMKHGQAAFAAYLPTLKPEDAFAELKKASAVFDPEGKMTDMLKTVEGAGTEFKKSFITAMSNPQFMDFLRQPGNTMLTPESLQMLAKPDYQGYVNQLLTNIGTHDMFKDPAKFEELKKFGDEKVQPFMQAHADLERLKKDKASEEKIREQELIVQERLMEMAEGLRGFGVDVPIDFSPEAMEFMKRVFWYGDNVEDAMNDMLMGMADKGMSLEAMQAMRDQIQPFAGILQYVAAPYAEFARKHGATFQQMATNTMDRVEKISDGLAGKGYTDDPAEIARRKAVLNAEYNARRNPDNENFQANAAGDEPARETANADTGLTRNGEFQTAALGVTIRRPETAPAWAQPDNINRVAPAAIPA